MTESLEQTAEWFYAGQRLDANHKLFHYWLDHEAQFRSFGKLKASCIGGRYLVTFTEQSAFINGDKSPKYLGEPSSNMRDEWIIETRTAITMLEMYRLEKSAKNDDLKTILQPLSDRYKSTIGKARRAALLAAVIQEITG